MTWDLYTEDPDAPDPPYTAFLPASLKDVVEEPPSRFALPDWPPPQPQPGWRLAPDAGLFYSVAFHANRTEILSATSDFADGDWVITDADRGIDIGRIVGPAAQPSARDMRSVKAIARRATQREIALIPDKQQQQERALRVCREKVTELDLAMDITGAEFQFDRKKVTFYYSASKYIDFRNLVRILFKFFGTRIWMVWYDGEAPVKDVFTRREE
jgi:hypothetical protein